MLEYALRLTVLFSRLPKIVHHFYCRICFFYFAFNCLHLLKMGKSIQYTSKLYTSSGFVKIKSPLVAWATNWEADHLVLEFSILLQISFVLLRWGQVCCLNRGREHQNEKNVVSRAEKRKASFLISWFLINIWMNNFSFW
jgi:hypothetical protein